MDVLRDLVSPELETMFDDIQSDMQAAAEALVVPETDPTTPEVPEVTKELSRQERINTLAQRLGENVRPAGKRGGDYTEAELLSHELIVLSMKSSSGIVRAIRLQKASERARRHLGSLRGEE
jgi:hypothetical protein